ncbi:D-alanyl-D-alanine carboxypeptidase (DacC) (PDB:1HD8) [Commensalibacter communis]|uniref:D-alanyl-D-alanine carboxypeptidase family protein n=1 Tax=Commensalibacter communis TaxID=2972786 RepID=UPI0022FFAED8|nr:D-alanyl-D-alanine carboxypeptidase family protein [Commensalibacter communis]CAI3945247.1 D-alanyl-D-alanine carboxypeptidase (DacC) (PDB:1HD8) [Commensalibacter communis]CAI3946524.1 D-alanyl-D-alanine carboxypeptidase (DacC) (PDB:1HD8) [Commensalibacter communis]
MTGYISDCNHDRLMKKHFTIKKPLFKLNTKKAIGFFAFSVSLCAFLLSPTAHAQYTGRISTIVTDINGKVISKDDPDLQRYPASLTKMMTLYMTFRALHANAISLNQRIPVSIHASSMEPSKLGLRAGSTITVREAILGLVTKSANDAACALGEFIGGGDEPRFAQMMTQQARVIGMNDSTFRNASGLPNPDQVTTARDMATLARHLILDYPEYYPFFKVPSFNFRGRTIPNHDPLIKGYAGADGLKTGYTAAAGHNLVGSAVQGNVRLVGVVMGAPSNSRRNTTMMSALDDGFSKYGVTPAERPLVLARATPRGRYHKRSKVILARASRSSKGGVVQVAQLPVKSKKAKASKTTTKHVVKHKKR